MSQKDLQYLAHWWISLPLFYLQVTKLDVNIKHHAWWTVQLLLSILFLNYNTMLPWLIFFFCTVPCILNQSVSIISQTKLKSLNLGISTSVADWPTHEQFARDIYKFCLRKSKENAVFNKVITDLTKNSQITKSQFICMQVSPCILLFSTPFSPLEHYLINGLFLKLSSTSFWAMSNCQNQPIP